MKQKLLFTVVGVTMLGLLVSGCSTFCKRNQKSGMALITCQPMDKHATGDKTVTLKVEAKGDIFAYQWFFRGSDGKDTAFQDTKNGAVSGAQTAELVLKKWSKAGFAFCEIHAFNDAQEPVRTRTRDAALGYEAPLPTPAAKLGGVQTAQITVSNLFNDVTQHGPMPNSGGSTPGGCCDYCGYIPFNNGGAGFQATSSTTTSALLSVSVDGNATLMPTNQYCIRWRVVGATTAGCSSAGDATHRSMAVNPNKKYTFTVYFTPGNCPPANTEVYFNIDWQP